MGAGASAADVLYSNPVKPPAHIAGAFAAGVRRFAVDAPEELEKVAVHAPGAGVYVRLRVDDTGSRFPLSAKFGVPVAQAGRLLRDAVRLGLRPEGVTFHVGSQCTDVDAWARAVRACAPLLTELLADGVRLRLLDLGGGFPARYADETPPPLEDLAARVLDALDELPYLPDEVVCEPGRAVVAESAVLGATVIGLATREGRRWVYTDVGAYNGLMEAAQTGGRLAFPLRTSRTTPGPTVRGTVTGPSCDSSDTLLADVEVPADLEVGDRVYLSSAGAYSLCYAAAFNGFAVPRSVYLA
jgi:ornithine decarboxylase